MIWRGGRVAEGNGLLNRRMGINPYRGFESRPLRFLNHVFKFPFILFFLLTIKNCSGSILSVLRSIFSSLKVYALTKKRDYLL
jgi:hypothetical protein